MHTQPVPFLSRAAMSALILGGAACLLLACGQGYEGDPDGAYAAFRAGVYQEPDSGVFIVAGDVPVAGEDALRSFFAQHLRRSEVRARQQGLILGRVGDADSRWSDSDKLHRTCCVSTTFGPRYAAVRDAMHAAGDAWEALARVRFRDNPAKDGRCHARNRAGAFDVRPPPGQPCLARAFFPHQGRSTRSLLIAASSFGDPRSWTLAGILRHAPGHVLGLRHEHSRPEAGTCFEDNDWRPLTSSDPGSVMHDPRGQRHDPGRPPPEEPGWRGARAR